MREAFALIRAAWLSATSYRLSTVLSLGALLVSVVPIYFVTGALQPLMAKSIQGQGGQYFAFLIVGMVTFSFISTAVNSFPRAISSGISTGTLEALLTTPAGLPSIFSGLVGYGFLWIVARSVLLLIAAMVLGAHFEWERSIVAAGVMVLIVLTYLSFGIIAASSVLAFRTQSPLPQAVLTVSLLLGGVYFPTKVIPSWIEQISSFVPLTYGLRALRMSFLEGAPLRAVAADIAILSGFLVVLLAGSVYVFGLALNYAKRSGTLAQY